MNVEEPGRQASTITVLRLHQQKNTLRLMRRRCALMQATSLLRSMFPLRPEFRSNALKHPVLPGRLAAPSLS